MAAGRQGGDADDEAYPFSAASQTLLELDGRYSANLMDEVELTARRKTFMDGRSEWLEAARRWGYILAGRASR